MIRLRQYQPSDAEVILNWIPDEIAFRKWCADRYDRYPITAAEMNRCYQACDTDRLFPMTAIDDNGIIGHLILRYPDKDRAVIRFGFVIVDSEKRGRGYGKQMLQKAIRYAFDVLKADEITLGVFENNESAYRCYRSVGFRERQTEEAEIYPIFGESWKCIELFLKNNHEETKR